MSTTEHLTRHARRRAQTRCIPIDQIDLAFNWGREVHIRGAWIFAVGHREVAEAWRTGVDISHAEGVHVVCSPDGAVITVYRNRSLSGLRPRHRHAA
jgi:hypothetical protein